jgi:hypothetical protein
MIVRASQRGGQLDGRRARSCAVDRAEDVREDARRPRCGRASLGGCALWIVRAGCLGLRHATQATASFGLGHPQLPLIWHREIPQYRPRCATYDQTVAGEPNDTVSRPGHRSRPAVARPARRPRRRADDGPIVHRARDAPRCPSTGDGAEPHDRRTAARVAGCLPWPLAAVSRVARGSRRTAELCP